MLFFFDETGTGVRWQQTNALINFRPMPQKSQSPKEEGLSRRAGHGIYVGSSPAMQNFCIEFERGEPFFYFISFFLQVVFGFSFFMHGSVRSGGLGKQKDFAAKANGFLVSCYYFIWPEPGDSDNCNFSRAIVASILQLL